MEQQRKRRKRRGFRKPDTVIVTLSSLAVVLLLIWGGLYLKESSKRELTIPENGEEQAEQAMIETVAPMEQSNGNPGITGQVPQLPEAAMSAKDPVTKPQTQSPVKSESNSTPSNDSPSTAETLSPSPSIDPTNPPISPVQNYEKEIIQVQVMCTKDMKEVISGAESSIRQLDKTDPTAVQAWREKRTKELADAESKCDGKFQDVSQNAENDSVSPKVIEEWKQTFIDLKEKLQGESEAKLLQLMGG
jgi:hypothetical protein